MGFQPVDEGHDHHTIVKDLCTTPFSLKIVELSAGDT